QTMLPSERHRAQAATFKGIEHRVALRGSEHQAAVLAATENLTGIRKWRLHPRVCMLVMKSRRKWPPVQRLRPWRGSERKSSTPAVLAPRSHTTLRTAPYRAVPIRLGLLTRNVELSRWRPCQ